MGKGRPRAVEKGVSSQAYATAGSLIVPPAPVFHPTEEEFKDPLAYVDAIRPHAEPFGICRIVPPKSWSPPFAFDLSRLKFPTKSQAIHRLQARPAACDPETFALEYRRFLASHLGKNVSRWRPPVFDGTELDLCLLFNSVKRFGGYDSACKDKRWGDVLRLIRPAAGPPTACSQHVLRQLYCEHLCDYEDHLAAQTTQSTKKNNPIQSPQPKKRPLRQPEKPAQKRRKSSGGENVANDGFDQICEQCKSGLHGKVMLLCDRCNKGWHLYCLTPPLESVPSGNWYCQECVNSDKDSFGFVPGKCCSVDEFRRLDERTRRKWFSQGNATRSQIEKRFWDIVEGRAGEVEVMYGNDLDTSKYGSGFPRVSDLIPSSVDAEEWKEYCCSPWNLNNLPKLSGSMLRAVQDNIPGVIVPWLYVGMLFSSFCWHVEDHCFYSINYLHWGEPKCWYGVPGGEAKAFEEVMRKTLPDLFDAQPDLLFQLVTMLSPSVLQENGVPVYGVVQEPGNFVITFPRSFHGGFNFGLNCAEAVNFAPADWLPHGGFGAERYRLYHKAAVLSHEELLYVVAKNGSDTKALPYLTEEMHRIFARERTCREDLWRKGIVRSSPMSPRKRPQYVSTEEDPTCIICQQYLYLSAVTCSCRPSAFVCLEHRRHLCECNPSKHRLLYRHTLAELGDLVHMCSGSKAENPIRKIPLQHQTTHNESSPLMKKVKGGHITYAQLAEDWLLKSCQIVGNPFNNFAYSTALKEAEQFIWADHDMDPIRDMTSKLLETQKWAVNIRKCLSKVDLGMHEDNLEKVSLFEIEQLLSFDPSCSYEPELTKLKGYAKDARLLVAEMDSVLSSHLHIEELESLYTRAIEFPIYVEETGKLARKISSAKVLMNNAWECLSEKRPGAIVIEFLNKLRSEMVELHVQIPEMKLLLDFCGEVDSWQVRCKAIMTESLKLKELEGFLQDAENVTVCIPELELLRQNLSDAHSWIRHLHGILEHISEREDHENVIRELSCVLKSGEMLSVQVDELHLVETELKRSCCRERASKALSVRMPLESIQFLMSEASLLGIESEKLFMEISEVLAAAISWEEKAKFVLGQAAHLPEFEDLIRTSENIFVILPSLPFVKDVVSSAQSWISRSQPYLRSTTCGAEAVGPLLKIDELKELVAESKFIKVTLESPKRLQNILKEVDEWANNACSLLQNTKSLLYANDKDFRIDSHLSVKIEELLKRIDSATESGHSLGFEFNEILILGHASLTLQWCLKALSFCSGIPMLKEVDTLLEDAGDLPDTFSGNNLTEMLVEGSSWLRKACTIIPKAQRYERCKLKDAEEILEEIQRIVIPYPMMVAQLRDAIRKHEFWVKRARAFLRRPRKKSWASLLNLKVCGISDCFDCPELDEVAYEVGKVEKSMRQCHFDVEPLVGDLGSLYHELTQIRGTLYKALSIYDSSRGSGMTTFCTCREYIVGNEEKFICLTCEEQYHFSCMGPPLSTAGMTNEYACPFCVCMKNGTISRSDGRPLICRGNRPGLNSLLQLYTAVDFYGGVPETGLLQEIVKLALQCKSSLGEIVNRSSCHRDRDLSSVSESLRCALKAVAVAGVYDHKDGCSLELALSIHAWKIRVDKLLKGPKKPAIQRVQKLFREGITLSVPSKDHFMQEITKLQTISLQWADVAKKVASDLGTIELNEVFKLIDEGETLPIHFEKEMKLLKARSELYCICRKPYDQRAMIACDQCDEWYHFECIHLQGPLPNTFFCPACRPMNGELISLPPSISQGVRSCNESEPWTPPASQDESKIRLCKKSSSSQQGMQVLIDLRHVLRCCGEIDHLWRQNRRPLQRITRKRCDIESLSFFEIPTCK